jgi:hypothetical protein
MDEFKFAQALKDLAAASDRRHALRSLGLVGMALLAGFGMSDDGEAKKKKKGGGRKKCKGNTKKCGKKCIPSTNCCSNADCDGGACAAGTCQCLGGSKPCDGACIPEEQCCDNGDCDDGNSCTLGICNSDRNCSYPNKPDHSYCGGNNNQCSGGVCATPPNCTNIGFCIHGSDCCSNVCEFVAGNFNCLPGSNPGQPCWYSDDCNTGTCVGFVCRA